MGNIDNIQITPVNVSWKQVHTDLFDFAGKTGTDLAGKYVVLYPAGEGAGHYAFFTTGSSTDPAPTGLTKITVTITAADTAAQLATKFATAVAAVTGDVYDATANAAVATVVRGDVGQTIESSDGTAPNATGIRIRLSRRGRDFDLGLLEGDVGLSFEPSNFEVKSHQTGVTPRAALFQGLSTLECTTTLLETDASQLEVIYNLYGGSFTPSGGTKIYGVGSAAQGKNLLTEAGRLVLKPVNAEDDSQNFNMMLAIPVPGSLTFSGENPRKLEITWKGFIDQDFNAAANAIAIGDVFQTGV